MRVAEEKDLLQILIIISNVFIFFLKAISGNSQVESNNQVNEEFVKKIGNSIRLLKSEKYVNHTRSVAELKEDYSMEDDLFIMGMRNDLMDMYYEYINPG